MSLQWDDYIRKRQTRTVCGSISCTCVQGQRQRPWSGALSGTQTLRVRLYRRSGMQLQSSSLLAQKTRRETAIRCPIARAQIWTGYSHPPPARAGSWCDVYLEADTVLHVHRHVLHRREDLCAASISEKINKRHWDTEGDVDVIGNDRMKHRSWCVIGSSITSPLVYRTRNRVDQDQALEFRHRLTHERLAGFLSLISVPVNNWLNWIDFHRSRRPQLISPGCRFPGPNGKRRLDNASGVRSEQPLNISVWALGTWTHY